MLDGVADCNRFLFSLKTFFPFWKSIKKPEISGSEDNSHAWSMSMYIYTVHSCHILRNMFGACFFQGAGHLGDITWCQLQSFCVTLAVSVRPTKILRQLDMGSLTCTQMLLEEYSRVWGQHFCKIWLLTSWMKGSADTDTNDGHTILNITISITIR